MQSDAMPDVRLSVDGRLYGGWQRIRVRRGIERIANDFELGVTERWAGQDTVRPIRPGARTQLTIDGTPVITGAVDEVSPTYSAASHDVTISGRDATGDLVDCSAPPTQFAGRTLLDVARALAQPFGIKVRAEAPVGQAFRTLKSEDGETVFEVLEQAARIRAVLLVSDGLGGLVITRAGRGRVGTPLVLGQNVKEGMATLSMRDRYRDYQIKGQLGGGSQAWDADDDALERAQVLGTAHDAGVPRHRPLTVLAEEQIDRAGAGARAKWERNVRVGRATRVTYTVTGWHHAAGLWAPNLLVPVRDDYLGINGDMLIASVTHLLDDQGLRTELEVVLPAAFDLVELPEPTERAQGALRWPPVEGE